MLSNIEQFSTDVFDKLELTDEAKKGALYGCAAIGAWQVLKAGKNVAYGVWKHFLRPRHNLKARYAQEGQEAWAVITGAADGIGKAYAL